MALKGEPGARAATLWSVVRRLLVIVLAVTGLLTVASAVWDLPLTPFIALGSAVGIAIGLGAQQLIQDVVAGFFLLLEDQYRIGDSVTLAGTSGDVEEIRLRVTVLRDVGGNVHYIPNGEIRLATNMTRDYAQVVLDVTVGFETDVDRVIAILGEEVTSMAGDGEWTEAFLGAPEVLGVDRIGESGVVVRVTAKVPSDGGCNARPCDASRSGSTSRRSFFPGIQFGSIGETTGPAAPFNDPGLRHLLVRSERLSPGRQSP